MIMFFICVIPTSESLLNEIVYIYLCIIYNFIRGKGFSMKKIFLSAVCMTAMSISLFGCSMKSPEEVIKEGVENNKSEEIINLYKNNKMNEELEKVFAQEIEKKSEDIYSFSSEEFANSPYYINTEKLTEIYPITADNLDELGEIIALPKYAEVSEDVSNSILNGLTPAVAGYSLYQYGNSLEEEKDYANALNTYQNIVTNENIKEDSTIKNNAIKRAEEVSKHLLISVGETKSVGNIDFTLEKLEFSHRVEPVNKPILYSYYSPDGDKVYIYLKANIKNNSKNDLRCDEIYDVEVIYDNDYSYEGFQVVQDDNLGFTYSNITTIAPLTTKGVDTLVECPAEVETNTTSPVAVKIIFNTGEVFLCNLR